MQALIYRGFCLCEASYMANSAWHDYPSFQAWLALATAVFVVCLAVIAETDIHNKGR